MRDVLVGILGFVIICAVWYFAWRVIFVFMHVGMHDPFGLLCLILAIIVPISAFATSLGCAQKAHEKFKLIYYRASSPVERPLSAW
jgi:hypothetical protein